MFLDRIRHKFLRMNSDTCRHIMYCMKLHNFHRTIRYNLMSILSHNCHYNCQYILSCNCLSILNRNCHCNYLNILNRNCHYNCPSIQWSNHLYKCQCSCCHSLLYKWLNKFPYNLYKPQSNFRRMLRYTR